MEENDTPKKRRSWFGKLREGLAKTRSGLTERVKEVLTFGAKIDEEMYENLEEVLIQADVGVNTSLALIDRVRARVRDERINDAEKIQPLIAEEMRALLKEDSLKIEPTADDQCIVILLVGVNGAGKTTTAGKLAHRFVNDKKRVLIAAGDTFRAAAIDQLKVWADRTGADFIAHAAGGDPAAVAYDAIHAARARKVDVCIIDTAGRLQTKGNLMQELGKVYRVIERELSREPDETLLVVDGTTGQNALSQGRIFREAVPLTGIALTKLDGTAKGGIVLAVGEELDLPVKLVGIGEGIDDLKDFDPDDFVAALFDS